MGSEMCIRDSAYTAAYIDTRQTLYPRLLHVAHAMLTPTNPTLDKLKGSFTSVSLTGPLRELKEKVVVCAKESGEEADITVDMESLRKLISEAKAM